MATQLEEAPDEGVIGERDFEEEARSQGWTPKEDFKGNPEQWIDAEAFVKRGESVMPLLKKQNQSLKGEIDFLKRQVKKLAQAEQKAYESALADLKSQAEEAVQYGDVEAYRKIDKKIDTLRKDIEDEAQSDDPGLAFAEFREANEWYDLGGLAGASDSERRARALADRIADKLAAQGLQKELTPSQFFQRVAEQVKEQIPMLGGEAKQAKPKPPSDVAGVTRPGAGRTARNGANLPPEAKAQALRFFERGIIKAKDKAEALDKFAKDYAWD